jgi:CheY-like chemotaxis protein
MRANSIRRWTGRLSSLGREPGSNPPADVVQQCKLFCTGPETFRQDTAREAILVVWRIALSVLSCARMEKFVSQETSIVVLCVDDDARALMVRSLILSVAGYEVQTASMGDAALRIFHHSHIDLVIADQDLPGINGWTLAAEMKKLKPEVPVVLLTGATELPTDKGAADLALIKCMEPPQFLATIEKLVATRGLYLLHDLQIDGRVH